MKLFYWDTNVAGFIYIYIIGGSQKKANIIKEAWKKANKIICEPEKADQIIGSLKGLAI